MKSKTAKITLLSGLALAAIGTINLTETASADQVTDPAAKANATNGQAQSPTVTVTDAKVDGNTTSTTAQVTSKELETAKAAANQDGLSVTETSAQQQPSVAAADADNKAQAQVINEAVANYDKAKAELPQKQAQYQQDLAAYNAKKAEYDVAKQAYEQYQQDVANGTAVGRVEKAQKLVFETEHEAAMTIEGVDQYLTKAARESHKTQEILQQFNTDLYPNTEFTNVNPYDPKEDTWFKMKVGDKVTVTYTNLLNASYRGIKISKLVNTYQLNSSSNADGTAIVELFHDPTKTIFVGAQTTSNQPISVTMQMTFYDENGDPIDLSNSDDAIIGLSSLNHWQTENGDHIEKVTVGENDFVQISGSSVSLHGNSAYSENDNQYKDNGATFNGDGEDGWDLIHEDGKPRAATAYYGAGAMTYKGKSFTVTVGGNDLNLPTTIWFTANSAVAVPKDPGVEPTPPTEPSLTKPAVTWHKNFVVNKQTKEVPLTPNQKPEDPKTTVTAKSISFRPARKDEMRVREREYQATLPHTGDHKQNGLIALGCISTAFAAATLIAAKKRED